MRNFTIAFSCLVFSFAFGASQLLAQITISGTAANAQAGNVLRYDVDFTTTAPAMGQVTYGYWNGTDSIWQSTDVQGPATNHQLTIRGLREGTAYNFRSLAFDTTGCAMDAWQSFTTGTVPGNIGVGRIDSVWSPPGANITGYLLTNTLEPNPRITAMVHDREGNLIWYEEFPGDPSPSEDLLCQQFNYDYARESMILWSCDHIYEVSFDGSVVTDIDVNAIDPDYVLHHDAFFRSNGNIAAIVSMIDTVDKSSVGGSANAPVVGQGIIEVDPQGNLIWDWNTFDHYNPLTSPGPGGYWAPKFGPDAISWKHANSLAEDTDGNYMISFEAEDQVAKVSRSNGNVIWTGGPGGTLDILPTDTFAAQNGIRVAGPNEYMLFDNQGLDSLSRAIEWWIDWGYTTPTMMISWEFVLPQEYFSPSNSNVERLANGGTFFSSGETGAIFEFNANGNQKYFARQDTGMHRAFWVEDLYPREMVSYTGDTNFCATDSVVQLVGSPSGGFWSGPNVTGNGWFDAATAAAGSSALTYKYGTTTVPVTVHVDDNPACGVSIDPRQAQTLNFTAYPNPFGQDLTLVYELPKKAELIMEVFALDGRVLAFEEYGTQSPGKHMIHLDTDELNLPHGAFMLCLRTTEGAFGAKVLFKSE